MQCPNCNEEIGNRKVCPVCQTNIAEFLAQKAEIIAEESESGVGDIDNIIDIDLDQDDEGASDKGKAIVDIDQVVVKTDIGFENQINKSKELCIAEKKFLLFNVEEALPILEHLARNNDGRAFFLLGAIYYFGYGNNKADVKKAESCWRLGKELKDLLCTLKILNGQELEEYLEANAERIQDYTSLNDPIVNTAVAEAYYNPSGINEKTDLCVELWEKAAEENYWLAYYRLALYYDKLINSPVSAEEYYGKAADAGYGPAAVILAEKIAGSSKDEDKLFELYSKAALDGDAEALNKVGECYANGLGTEQDCAMAFNYYEKAARNGSVNALFNLAQCYLLGAGIEKNETQAFKNCLKAAESGLPIAQNRVAFFYKFGQGTFKDVYKAFYWFEQAAENGLEFGMLNLAKCYEKGEGTAVDYETAARWYDCAANLGNADAQYSLGRFYENGIGVEMNERKAVKYFETAAEQEHVEAMSQLAYYYLNGEIVGKNPTKAKTLYSKAAEQGDAYAMNELGLLYFNGIGTERDMTKAAALFREAVEDELPEAYFNLGLCCAYGYGTAKNLKEAEMYCRLALKNGHEDAETLLKQIVEASGRKYVKERSAQADKVEKELTNNDKMRILIKQNYRGLQKEYREFYLEPNIPDLIKSEVYNAFVAKILANSGASGNLKDILAVAPDCRRVGANYLDSVVVTTDAICTRFGWCIPLKLIGAVAYEGNTLYITYLNGGEWNKVALSDMYLGVAKAASLEKLIMELSSIAKNSK